MMMPSMPSEQYEVMYTLRSEFAKKNGYGPGGYGPPRGLGPRGFGPAPWLMDASPAEREVFMKFRARGTSRTAFGGLLGATAMAGIWNAAALGTTMGVVGVLGWSFTDHIELSLRNNTAANSPNEAGPQQLRSGAAPRCGAIEVRKAPNGWNLTGIAVLT
ncbi:hypothetical protein ON010_g16049 [Phytophthora cinnamomi]|nr:hypothetical protein ON010_g16049 [Phytophthora cinnamomi]